MFCIHCGNELPDGAKFCPNCGNAVETIAANQDNNIPEHSEYVDEVAFLEFDEDGEGEYIEERGFIEDDIDENDVEESRESYENEKSFAVIGGTQTNDLRTKNNKRAVSPVVLFALAVVVIGIVFSAIKTNSPVKARETGNYVLNVGESKEFSSVKSTIKFLDFVVSEPNYADLSVDVEFVFSMQLPNDKSCEKYATWLGNFQVNGTPVDHRLGTYFHEMFIEVKPESLTADTMIFSVLYHSSYEASKNDAYMLTCSAGEDLTISFEVNKSFWEAMSVDPNDYKAGVQTMLDKQFGITECDLTDADTSIHFAEGNWYKLTGKVLYADKYMGDLTDKYQICFSMATLDWPDSYCYFTEEEWNKLPKLSTGDVVTIYAKYDFSAIVSSNFTDCTLESPAGTFVWKEDGAVELVPFGAFDADVSLDNSDFHDVPDDSKNYMAISELVTPLSGTWCSDGATPYKSGVTLELQIEEYDETHWYVDAKIAVISAEPSMRYADVHTSGVLKKFNYLTIDFDDDGWGNSGVAQLHILSDGTVGFNCEIKKYGDNANWDLGTAYTILYHYETTSETMDISMENGDALTSFSGIYDPCGIYEPKFEGGHSIEFSYGSGDDVWILNYDAEKRLFSVLSPVADNDVKNVYSFAEGSDRLIVTVTDLGTIYVDCVGEGFAGFDSAMIEGYYNRTVEYLLP